MWRHLVDNDSELPLSLRGTQRPPPRLNREWGREGSMSVSLGGGGRNDVAYNVSITYAETLRASVCNLSATTSSHERNLHITEIAI